VGGFHFKIPFLNHVPIPEAQTFVCITFPLHFSFF